MFEDKNRVRDRHVSAIYNVAAMHRESAQDLSELINTVELHSSALKSLVENAFSTMMLCIVFNKIDKSTRKLWKMSLKEDELSSYEQFIIFL